MVQIYYKEKAVDFVQRHTIFIVSHLTNVNSERKKLRESIVKSEITVNKRHKLLFSFLVRNDCLSAQLTL